jgi:hypothetical protein
VNKWAVYAFLVDCVSRVDIQKDVTSLPARRFFELGTPAGPITTQGELSTYLKLKFFRQWCVYSSVVDDRSQFAHNDDIAFFVNDL